MTQQQTRPEPSPAAIEAALARIDELSPAQRELLERVLAQSGVDIGIRRRGRGVDIPASYEQERLWFMAQLVAHAEMFHVPTALRFAGPLDEDAFRRAFAQLVERHEALRTVFRETSDGVVQVVLDELAAPVQIDDLRGVADPWAEARERGTKSVGEPFDLTCGPLVRPRLYRTADEEYLFVFTEHHIISDYWSLGIVLADLGALYDQQAGSGAGLAPIDLHYPDFAVWQRKAVAQQAIRTQLEHWRDRLADLPESLDLPTDRPRPAIRGSQGKFFPVEFDHDLVARLRELAAAESTTLLGAFLAAYVGLLSRLVRGTDIVVGVPVAGRPRPELQQMVGYFLNWLPIRVDVADRPSLRELVHRTGVTLADAMANQDIPFDMLVRELDPIRRPGTTPIFQTSFSLRDSAPVPPRMPGVDVTFAEIDGSATHFDLMAELWQEQDRVTGYLPYDEELFDESTVADVARWFQRFLAEGLAAPECAVSDLQLFEQEERVVVHGTTVAAAEPPTDTLHARFAAQALRRPHAVAVSDENCSLGYAELLERSHRTANVLREHGVRQGDLVALVCDRTVDLVSSLLGVLACGAAYLPVDPESPPERVALQFAGSPVAAVLATPGHEDVVPEQGPRPIVVDWDDPVFATASGEPPTAPVGPDAPAYVIHTSGSTGAPKGVVITHANVLRLFDAANERFDVDDSDTWTLFHSYAFDFSVWEIWGALLHGGRLIVVPQWMTRAPDVLADHLASEAVTVLSATPSAFVPLASEIVRRRPEGLGLRYVVFGGEALDHAALQDWFDEYGDQRPQLINMYGITETTVHVTHRQVTRADLDRHESLIGAPLADLSVYLLDDELQPVPTGVPGELVVGGRGVALGYSGDPALTAQRMVPDPWSPEPGRRMYRSGDVAVRRRDGELAYLGRGDDQHKIRGHRIELGEIRAAIKALPNVARSAVVVGTDRVGGKSLLAWIVPEPDTSVRPGQLRRALLQSLPEWMVPSAIDVIDELPLTRNGKLDSAALLARRGEQERAEGGHGTPPRGDTALALGGIWSELLGLANPSADDHFFEMGGHSLMVVQLVSRIRTQFGVDVPMATLFERPNLQPMADAIDELRTSAPPAELVPDGAPSSELPPDAPLDDVRDDIARRLDPLVRPAAPRQPQVADADATVMVTGATGFIGAHVLLDLVGRGNRVVALVRGGTDRRDALLAKVRQAGGDDAVAAALDDGRVTLVDGDIAEPRWGLADHDHQDLAHRVDVIIHAAAAVNHVYPYAQLAAANAHSPAAVLELAGTGRPKRIAHLSASSVVESAAYDDDEVVGSAALRALPTGPAGYARSKAVAELYYEHAASFDASAVVVRVPSVFGGRERHAVNPTDAVWSWIRAMLETGAYPASFDIEGNELFQALPADVVARIVVDEALRTHTPGCRWVNAIPGTAGTTVDLVAAARECGFSLRPREDSEWYAEVSGLDPSRIWVAGIAGTVAASIASAPDPTARKLRRFVTAATPDLERTLAEHAISKPHDIAGYLRTVADL